MTLGLLSIHSTQETEYFTEIAKRGHFYKMKVVRFTPSSINPITELVEGLSFDETTQAWKPDTFPIPSFIYDRCFYNRSQLARKSKPIVDWLKKRPQTTFLGYGLPDKLQTYSILAQNRTLAPYIPSTEKATEDTILKGLATQREVVLKPISGSQGNGLCHISYKRNNIQAIFQQAKETKMEQFHTKGEFSAWLVKLLNQQSYMIQPFLSIQDRYHRPFDIRILLQKNEQGQWLEAGRGVRVGGEHSLVSNLNAGSTVVSYDDWKKSYSRRDVALLEENLATILQTAPAALEDVLPPLFELGFDISFDHTRAVWLLDVNSKPGRKVILHSNPSCAEQMYRAPLVYCKGLAEMQKGADVT